MKTPPSSRGNSSSPSRKATTPLKSSSGKNISFKQPKTTMSVAPVTPTHSRHTSTSSDQGTQTTPTTLSYPTPHTSPQPKSVTLNSTPTSNPSPSAPSPLTGTFRPLPEGTPIRMTHATLDVSLSLDPITSIIDTMSSNIFSSMRSLIINTRHFARFRSGKSSTTSYAALMTAKLRETVEREKIRAKRELGEFMEPELREVWEGELREKEAEMGEKMTGIVAEGAMVYDGQVLRWGDGVKVIDKFGYGHGCVRNEEYDSDDDVEMVGSPVGPGTLERPIHYESDSDEEQDSDDEEERMPATPVAVVVADEGEGQVEIEKEPEVEDEDVWVTKTDELQRAAAAEEKASASKHGVRKGAKTTRCNTPAEKAKKEINTGVETMQRKPSPEKTVKAVPTVQEKDAVVLTEEDAPGEPDEAIDADDDDLFGDFTEEEAANNIISPLVATFTSDAAANPGMIENTTTVDKAITAEPTSPVKASPAEVIEEPTTITSPITEEPQAPITIEDTISPTTTENTTSSITTEEVLDMTPYCYCKLPLHFIPESTVYGCDGPKCKHGGWFHEICIQTRLLKKDWPKLNVDTWLCSGCGGYAERKVAAKKKF